LVLALAPVAAMIALGWSHISFSNLQPMIPDGTSVHTALNYALIFAVWCYSGFGGMAYASEEIVDPQRTYPRVLALLLPVSIVVYVLPLMVALGVTPEWDTWGTAHFNQVSLVLGGVWLMVLTSLAAQCANLGLFNGELLLTSRLPYAMAKDGVLPPFFAQLHSRYGTPSRFLLLQALFYSAMTYFLDFIEILVVSVWIAMPSYVLTAVMPLVLRAKRPDLRGPFRIPGGTPVLVLCGIPLVATSVYVLLTVSTREILIGAGFLAGIPILYLWSRWANQRADPTAQSSHRGP
jgi:amino acid transporter